MALTPSRLGQVEGANSTLALFEKIFSGEVLTNFNQKNVMASRSMTKRITHGKSATFPAIGRISTQRHVPGNDISTALVKHNEKEIFIDSVLMATALVPQIDEFQNHYEVRQPYVEEMSTALANDYDTYCFYVGLLGARTAASGGKIPDEAGGTSADYGATVETDASVLAGAIFDIAETFDENNVPEGDRFVAVKPAQYHLLVQGTDAINKDWGGMGSYSDGKILRVGGIEVVKSNNVPQADVSGGSTTGLNNTYLADNSDTVALGWHRSAIGTVKLRDMTYEQDYDIVKQGTIILEKMAVGHGWLRPSALYEITKTTP